ncbi:MAG: hypothetical protein WBK77_09355 [Alphaproteobacteria bacterium]
MVDTKHFKQVPRRKAEFIKPPNMLKTKVGSGGLGDDILDKAQSLLENNTVDFQPLADMYLTSLMRGIELAKEADPGDDQEYVISRMLYPGMQLKANGGMFHYPLVTRIAAKLIEFLEVIQEIDVEAIEIVLAFHTTMRAVVMGRVTGDGGRHGTELIRALNEACERYFEKYQMRNPPDA